MPQIRDASWIEIREWVVGGHKRINNEKIGVLPGMECATLVRVSNDPDRSKLMTRCSYLREHFGSERDTPNPGLQGILWVESLWLVAELLPHYCKTAHHLHLQDSCPGGSGALRTKTAQLGHFLVPVLATQPVLCGRP